MRYGIDASNLVSGGGTNHLINLLSHMNGVTDNTMSIIVWASDNLRAEIPRTKGIKVITVPDINGSSLRRLFWQMRRLPYLAQDVCDCILVPGGIAGNHSIPIISMSRNMLPFEMGEAFRYGISYMLIRLFYLRILQSRTFHNSSGVIFLSDYARNRIISQIGKLRGKTALIPHGINSRFFCEPRTQRRLESYSMDDPFRLLYVSVVDVYKHQWNVVEAVSQLRKKGIPIVLDIVGPTYGPARRKLTKALNVWDTDRSFVRCYGNIAHTELHHVFHKSDGFIFASTCENFPNILLEAMSSGLPIACSNRRPMTDILGDSCVLFDPLHPQSISDAINMMIVDMTLRDKMSKSVYEKASDYSWEKCSIRTFDFIAECAIT